RNRAQKAEMSPKLPAALPTRSANGMSVLDEKKQVLGGRLGAGYASGALIAGPKKNGAEGCAAAPAAALSETKEPPESRTGTDLSILGKSTQTVQVQSAAAPVPTP